MTKKYLDNKGLEYDLVDITEDDVALDRILGLGFASAPVVEAGELMFAGFNPTKLALLV